MTASSGRGKPVPQAAVVLVDPRGRLGDRFDRPCTVAASLPEAVEIVTRLLAGSPGLPVVVVGEDPTGDGAALLLGAGAQEVLASSAGPAAIAAAMRRAEQRAGYVGALARRSRQKELLHANASEGYAVVDGQGNFLYGNPSALSTRPMAELVGQSALSFVAPEHRARVEAVFAQVAGRAGATAELEVEVIDGRGARRWFEMTLSNLTHEESVGGIVTNYWDITERRRAEASSNFNATLLDAVGQAVIAIDPAGEIIYWNQAATELYGWAAAEVIGRRLDEVLVGADEDQIEAIMAALAERRPWSGESWIQGRDGPRFPVWVTDTPVFDANGELVAVIGVSTDISERKAAEAVLRRLSSIVESSTDAITSTTTDGVIMTWNRGAERLFGYTAEEALGRHVSMIVPPERTQELRDILEKASLGQAVERLETVRRHRDGRELQVLVSVAPLLGDDGVVVGVSDVTHDITERIVALRDRAAAEGRFEAAFLRSPIGMALSDLGGYPTAVNRALCDMLGREPDELVGQRWYTFGHPDEVSLGVAVRDHLAAGGDHYSDERRYIRPDGSTVWVQVSVNLVRSSDEEPMYFMLQMQDVTDRKVMERELQHRALHDDLTGLPNRALLNDRLDHALVAAERSGRCTGVAFLDVDGFKHVNDALGHAVGDRLLVEVGHRLIASVRPADTVARFGGDEYVLVCEDVTIEAMTGLAGRITEAMAQPFAVDGREVPLHASVGITISRSGSTSQSLLSEADAAMYRAKELGRGRAAVFDDSLRAKAASLLEGERALQAGITNGELVAYYQPIIEIDSETPVGVEALVRWHTPDGRIVLPEEFIPTAETSGLIVEIGAAVLAQATAAVARWNADNPDLPDLWVSVNLSARQLIDTGLASLVGAILEATGLPPGLLHLEITETVVMEDIAQSVLVLEELKRLGVKLSIDDFGTGYSSLSYLKQLPLDTLKIDRSFVRGLGSSPDDSSIVEAIVSLGQALGMGCLAEGVESGAQRDALARLGCRYGQGYLWSPALEPADAAAWAGSLGRLEGPVSAPGGSAGRG